jgi:predicted HTH transcriptional regulator
VALDLGDLDDIARNGDFGRLIGEVEDQFFDVKSQPYGFDENVAKREFAKDVSAFANAGGGYIFVGFSTKKTNVQSVEEVEEARPIDCSRFDGDQHHKVLEEWLYPRPSVDIRWTQFGTDQTKGIGVIAVPPQDERLEPFLIKRAQEGNKSTELMIGYAQRRPGRTEVRRIEEIHQALRTGLNFERELLGRFVGVESGITRLESMIGHLFGATAQAESIEKRSDLLRERIARLLEDARG